MAILKKGFQLQPVMSNFDKPGHTRIRRRLAKAFSTRRMNMLIPIIEERCENILDELAKSDTADLMHDLCYPLPALTIFTMIGFPDEDADQIKEWCADKLVVNWGRPTKEAQITAAETMVAFWKYCVSFVEQRRNNPGDDMTSDLISDEDMSEPLSDNEIASILFGLSFAGHETTTNLAANCIRSIVENNMWSKLRDNRDLILPTIEETLRYDSSFIAWRRIALEDTKIGDVDIPRGAKLMLSLGAANRDPNVYEDPDKFDPTRERPKDHLSFGRGIHFCLGAHLGRVELKIMLDQLLDRFVDMKIETTDFKFPPNIAFRGPISFPVKWTAE